MRINHNISALNAYRNLAVNTDNTSKSLEKLSSGLRINKASDDAAGLAISEKMRSQIRGLAMAERNALDGVSLIQTAEGALSSATDIIQRMRELAVQAGNGTYTDTDRAEIQKEINQLTSEINRIGNSTEFNKGVLLDGSRTKATLAGTVTPVSNDTGLLATVPTGSTLTDGTYSIVVTRTNVGTAAPANIETDSTTGPVFVASGAAADDEIGVTGAATADTWTITYNAGTPNQYALTNADGTKTAIINEGDDYADFGLNFNISGPGALNDGGSITFATVNPVDAYDYEMSLNGGTPVVVAAGVPEGVDPIVLANGSFSGLELNSLSLREGTYKFDVVMNDGKDGSIALQIGANAGQKVSLEINDMRAKSLHISSDVVGGGAHTITLLNGKEIQVWYTKAVSANNGVSSTDTECAVDVSTQESAQAAITVYDDAIQRISSERSRLGSIQNRLEYTVDNLKIMNENTTAAESRIRDVDMAMEMTEFTKNSILNQAAQAMLAQANQLPQGVLQLLK